MNRPWYRWPVPPLVQVARAARVMMSMPAHGVGEGQPAEKPGQFAIGLRPEHEMPVIGHHAVGQNSGWRVLVRLVQHTIERLVISLLLK